jgi:serine phosphatase RsbU (regulator of sigma subunit)
MKLRRFLYFGGAFLLVLVKFTIDVIVKNVELEVGGISMIRHLLVAGMMILFLLAVRTGIFPRDQRPVRRLGMLLIGLIAIVLAGVALSSAPGDGFDAKNLSLLPLDYPTLFIASLLGVIFGLFAVLLIHLLRDLILSDRKRGTRRNFVIFIVLVVATAASTAMLKPLDGSIVSTILFVLALILAIVNSFRLSWIIYLTKREKVFSLVYGFFLFFGCIGLNILLVQNSFAGRALTYYSRPAWEFIRLSAMFANIYFGMVFISTLFHLPTAEAFDRKRSEVTSLHNLSKLVTQVFDFNELVDTVTSMTLQVCEAMSCWLEIIYPPEEVPVAGADTKSLVRSDAGGTYFIQVVARKNIEQEAIDSLVPPGTLSVRDDVMRDLRPILIDDLERDGRFTPSVKTKGKKGSLVVVPLVAHAGLIGILYATKEKDYGFVKDDVEVISAFADQATVAIENSRLIKKSIERERLIREMMLAQEMQKKLLPQRVPAFPTVEIDAISKPAFEVGGDYYDFMQLDDRRIGIVVGDVSGKGVSAAFYMSEVKGIFQALSGMYSSPKEFLVKANAALTGSIDKHSFVSLIYGIVDVETGRLTLSRAGHCPMLHVSGDRVQYVRPNGMGLGLTDGVLFEEAIEEQTIHLREGDICVFYTDGITEAQRGDEEFGYERLLASAREARHEPASVIKSKILESVDEFIEHKPNHDDLTLIVLKWRA